MGDQEKKKEDEAKTEGSEEEKKTDTSSTNVVAWKPDGNIATAAASALSAAAVKAKVCWVCIKGVVPCISTLVVGISIFSFNVLI